MDNVDFQEKFSLVKKVLTVTLPTTDLAEDENPAIFLTNDTLVCSL